MEWVHVAGNRDQWRTVVDMVMNFLEYMKNCNEVCGSESCCESTPR